jgi:hypothetical protein
MYGYEFELWATQCHSMTKAKALNGRNGSTGSFHRHLSQINKYGNLFFAAQPTRGRFIEAL